MFPLVVGLLILKLKNQFFLLFFLDFKIKEQSFLKKLFKIYNFTSFKSVRA